MQLKSRKRNEFASGAPLSRSTNKQRHDISSTATTDLLLLVSSVLSSVGRSVVGLGRSSLREISGGLEKDKTTRVGQFCLLVFELRGIQTYLVLSASDVDVASLSVELLGLEKKRTNEAKDAEGQRRRP